MIRIPALVLLSGLLLAMLPTSNAYAAPEMRCRLSGAYIKMHAKSEEEQRKICEQQGGEYTRYVPQVSAGPAQGRDPSRIPQGIYNRR